MNDDIVAIISIFICLAVCVCGLLVLPTKSPVRAVIVLLLCCALLGGMAMMSFVIPQIILEIYTTLRGDLFGPMALASLGIVGVIISHLPLLCGILFSLYRSSLLYDVASWAWHRGLGRAGETHDLAWAQILHGCQTAASCDPTKRGE